MTEELDKALEGLLGTIAKDLFSILGDLGLADNVLDTVATAFRDMEMAEEVIAEQQVEHPEHQYEIWCLFNACARPEWIPAGAPDRLYRLHVRQLCEKVVAGESLETPTVVDCLGLGCRIGEHKMLKSHIVNWLATRPSLDWAAMFHDLGDGLYEPPAHQAEEVYGLFCELFEETGVGKLRTENFEKRKSKSNKEAGHGRA